MVSTVSEEWLSEQLIANWTLVVNIWFIYKVKFVGKRLCEERVELE